MHSPHNVERIPATIELQSMNEEYPMDEVELVEATVVSHNVKPPRELQPRRAHIPCERPA